MTGKSATTERSVDNHGWAERAEFGLIFAVTFVGFLVAKSARRLVPWREDKIERRRSIFATASEAAGTVSALAFMG